MKGQNDTGAIAQGMGWEVQHKLEKLPAKPRKQHSLEKNRIQILYRLTFIMLKIRSKVTQQRNYQGNGTRSQKKKIHWDQL